MSAYTKYALNKELAVEVLTKAESSIIFGVKGKNAAKCFQHEAGIHCIQRVPPTEKGGRVHTSIISVAVLPVPEVKEFSIPQSEIDIQQTKGSGPGGQNRNKVSCACRMTHKPTGIVVFIDGRDFQQNRKRAFKILSARVQFLRDSKDAQEYGDYRHQQVGTRGRGNKIRTYNFKNRRVVDHRLKKKTSRVEDVMNGRFDLLVGNSGSSEEG